MQNPDGFYGEPVDEFLSDDYDYGGQNSGANPAALLAKLFGGGQPPPPMGQMAAPNINQPIVAPQPELGGVGVNTTPPIVPPPSQVPLGTTDPSGVDWQARAQQLGITLPDGQPSTGVETLDQLMGQPPAAQIDPSIPSIPGGGGVISSPDGGGGSSEFGVPEAIATGAGVGAGAYAMDKMRPAPSAPKTASAPLAPPNSGPGQRPPPIVGPQQPAPANSGPQQPPKKPKVVAKNVQSNPEGARERIRVASGEEFFFGEKGLVTKDGKAVSPESRKLVIADLRRKGTKKARQMISNIQTTTNKIKSHGAKGVKGLKNAPGT